MNATSRLQRRMLTAGGTNVSACNMSRLTYSANALNVTLPGALAVANAHVCRRLRTWGASAATAGFTVLASNALSVAAFAAAAAVGIVVLVRRRPATVLEVAERGLAHPNRVRRRAPDSGRAALLGFGDEVRAIRPRRRDWILGLGQAELTWSLTLPS